MNTNQYAPALKHRTRLKFYRSISCNNLKYDGFPPIQYSKPKMSLNPLKHLFQPFLSLARCFSAGIIAFLAISQFSVLAQTSTPAATPDPAKLPGSYSVVRIDPEGNTKQGSLKLSVDGKLRFRTEWTFEDSKTEGLGFLREDVLALVDGPVGCRVLLYQAGTDGILNGIWSNVGSKSPQEQPGIEVAESSLKSDKPKLSGAFDLSRREPDNGEITRGKVLISPQDDYFQLFWTFGTNSYQGVGLATKERWLAATAAFLPKVACNLTMFQVNEDGTLEGSSIDTQKTVVNTVTAERIKDN